ncbi:hypothetical protein MCAG_00723 [Micromonospora sp. ATCC 39149]|uniref:Uncharacterized protein n=1 Tax=Micromonospora carbonacea TaxID=47853 RepID=A0A7D6CCL4_9ACTN|nr:hypothetical protein [Micromonospora sp. ATCC 39149]EEP70396.1 hypothetical protein MCAG_00723 [Micromonospora sp. ATCC 39149]QLJ96810.1 hypothetical protein HZU44_18095 [Micromonospora carbonacea]
MSDLDPHIHVVATLGASAATRNLLASTFGLAADLPTSVTTGCGVRAGYAMTSLYPERVTCLACREYAHREHLRLADEVERLGRMPGTSLDSGQVARAADQYRAIARQFAGRPGDADRR